MRIRIFSSFCSSEQATQNYKNVYNSDPGWFVCDDSYTHVIILNNAMPDISHIPPSNVVGLAFEPRVAVGLSPEFITYAQKYIGRYFIGDASGLPAPFEEHYSYMWHKWVSNPLPLTPRRGLSMMVSRQNSLAGHKYRYILANEILQENLPVDIWGNGVPGLKQKYGPLPQLKDSFDDSLTTLHGSYAYSIAIENTRSQKYISEKFNDCIIAGIIPVYLGARGVDDIYGSGTCIHLTGRLRDDMDIIRRLCALGDEADITRIMTSRKHLEESANVNLFVAIKDGRIFRN